MGFSLRVNELTAHQSNKSKKLFIRQPRLPHDALYNVLWQVESFVVRNRDSSWFGGMLHLDVRPASLVNVEACLLESANHFFRFQVSEFGRHRWT